MMTSLSLLIIMNVVINRITLSMVMMIRFSRLPTRCPRLPTHCPRLPICYYDRSRILPIIHTTLPRLVRSGARSWLYSNTTKFYSLKLSYWLPITTDPFPIARTSKMFLRTMPIFSIVQIIEIGTARSAQCDLGLNYGKLNGIQSHFIDCEITKFLRFHVIRNCAVGEVPYCVSPINWAPKENGKLITDLCNTNQFISHKSFVMMASMLLLSWFVPNTLYAQLTLKMDTIVFGCTDLISINSVFNENKTILFLAGPAVLAFVHWILYLQNIQDSDVLFGCNYLSTSQSQCWFMKNMLVICAPL